MGASMTNYIENRNRPSEYNRKYIFIKNTKNNKIQILHCCVPLEENFNKTKFVIDIEPHLTSIIYMNSDISNFIYIYDLSIIEDKIFQKIKQAQYLDNGTTIEVF